MYLNISLRSQHLKDAGERLNHWLASFQEEIASFIQGEQHRGNDYPPRIRAALQNGIFTSPDWDKRGKLKADAQLVRDIGLHLFVRHIDDVVIVDIYGKATIGRANDLLDNQL